MAVQLRERGVETLFRFGKVRLELESAPPFVRGFCPFARLEIGDSEVVVGHLVVRPELLRATVARDRFSVVS